MDTYADDLAAADRGARPRRTPSMVGHSTGGGEVARYIGRHGTRRVAKAVLVGAVPPLMLKTAANPGGLPIEVFDGIRAGVAADRSQFFKDLTTAVLRRQPAGRQGLAGHARRVLAAGHDGRPQERARLHQGVLRDRLHRGPEEVRRADADHPRRRRPDRARSAPRRMRVVEAGQGRDAEGLPRRRTALPRPTRTSSTPTCWRSSAGRRAT